LSAFVVHPAPPRQSTTAMAVMSVRALGIVPRPPELSIP
jgi:hypothetical protein